MEADGQGRELASKLALDAVALSLLYQSDEQLGELLKKEFSESHDENIRRFTRLLQTDQRRRSDGALAMAVGEIVLASFLAIVGIVAFVPNLIGLDSPRAFFDYFSGLVPTSLDSGPLFSAAVAIEFVLAALLMLGAFYTLRRAALSLKGVGSPRSETSEQ